MGSAIAQELALRHPQLVRSLVLVSTYTRPDPLFRSQLNFWRWLPEAAPSERAFFEAFFTWVYTPRAHADGTVDQFVEEALAFPHQQSVEAFQAQVEVCLTHDTADRLSKIAAPTLVLSGELDVILPPRFGRSVAAEIPALRRHRRGGPPALPGEPRRVQRPCRRLLARGRGARLRPPQSRVKGRRARDKRCCFGQTQTTSGPATASPSSVARQRKRAGHWPSVNAPKGRAVGAQLGTAPRQKQQSRRVRRRAVYLRLGRAASLRIDRLETPACVGSEQSVALGGCQCLCAAGASHARAAASSKEARMKDVLRIYI
jgi:pimeloyl-ACP methyl ester carboxylesterase